MSATIRTTLPPFHLSGSTHPIVFDRVWKRYQIGAQHDSLRDAIPSFFRRLTRRNSQQAAEPEFWALKDVSFHVNPGETLGIVGRNGAGKSTVLKLLSKITRQTQGEAIVRGRMAALIELGGGFHPDLNGSENIYLQGTMLGLSHREVAQQYDAIVAFSELERFLEMPVKRYSSGMVVRLGFAIAAQIHPDVLLIDEVLAVGDIAFQQKCFTRIEELKRAGTTMIFISHNLEAVQKLCDRIVVLHKGEVLSEGEPVEMLGRYRRDVLKDSSNTARAMAAASTNGAALSIRDVALLDATGSPVDTLTTGEPLRVAITYEVHRPIIAPAFRVAIERLDGLLCHVASTLDGALLPSTLTESGIMQLEYPAMNLLSNTYQVTVEAFEGSNPIPLASLRQSAFFHMTSPQAERGMVHLEHRWMLNGHSS